MTEIFPYLLGLVIGLITGLFYFVGLWFTVKKLPYSKKPNRLLALSTAVRLLPTLTIIFILIRKDPGIFVAMLSAFFAVRFIMIKRIAKKKDFIRIKLENSFGVHKKNHHENTGKVSLGQNHEI